MHGDCLFCKIANKEIPSDIVYEDDDFIAFKDLKAQAPVHILFVPKKHVASVDELEEDDVDIIGRLFLKIKGDSPRAGYSGRRIPRGYQLQQGRGAGGFSYSFSSSRRPEVDLAAGIRRHTKRRDDEH